MTETLGEPKRIGPVAAERQRRELLAAVAPDRVFLAERRLQPPRRLAQHLVAPRVAEAISPA